MTAIKTCRSARWLGDRVQKARLWTGQDKTRGRMRYALGSEGLPNIVQRIKLRHCISLETRSEKSMQLYLYPSTADLANATYNVCNPQTHNSP